MSAAFSAPINPPASQSKVVAGIRIGSANGLDRAKNILARFAKLHGAVTHLLAGPPMSERERYKQRVAEARARNLEGLAGCWFQPR